MKAMKNSALLDNIIDYAKTVGNSKDAPLTAERFIVSVIDFSFGIAPYETSAEEKNALIQMLASIFPLADPMYEDIKRDFLAYIKGGKKPSYLDGLYIQQRTYKARELAEQRGLKELPPELLLECIFTEPNDFIKQCMGTTSDKEASDGDKQAESLNALLRDLKEKNPNSLSGKDTDDGEPTHEDPEVGDAVVKSPKETVSQLIERVKTVQEQLLDSVYGQDYAISVFTAGYFQAELSAMTDKKRTRPSATFLFAGPPGVGKTFLTEKAAEVLGFPFMRFDMSEYAERDAIQQFCGSPKVYNGAKEGLVTSFVTKHPKCILLFDEIEKAHISVIHLFLQILDAGRVRDNHTDKEVSFTNAIIVFTTNAGRQLYEGTGFGNFSGVSRKVILNALRNDVHTGTRVPYFPAALCSRFASGNVVMFNHISANKLREIAKREILRHTKNFEDEIGIKVEIDELVFSALLFAEGSSADARTVRSRAETFFDNELFELFRLLNTEKDNDRISQLETIRINVSLPEDDPEVRRLFVQDQKPEVLLFSSKAVYESCKERTTNVTFLHVQSIETAKKLLRNHDISFVLIDYSYGRAKHDAFLNVEDIASKARGFFWYLKEYHSELPIYILQTPDKLLNQEEQLSFMRLGVSGLMTLQESADTFDREIGDAKALIHQQNSMLLLARANKLITYETAQSIRDKGKTAVITLFDFVMNTAVDSEDTKNILSNVSKPDIRFDQVIGAEEAKKELQYFVSYLKNPKRFLGTGVHAPKGVLLYGPPGTGKTMLAKAMASESDVTFITAEGNQFVRKYWGEGKDMVHELFRTARKYAPSILFIDEIDAIAKERTGGDNTGDQEATLTAFFTEMDGFKNDTSKPVFVLAATNYDVEPGKPKSLDPALMRRFDRRIYIELPTRDERIRFIQMKLSGKEAFELTEDKIQNIALRSTGMSLADLESVFELALRTAIRSGNLKVTDDVFEDAFETFIGGAEKHWDVSQLERVARHEAGHAFVCWQSGEAPSYITIVARGDHGGYMQHGDNEGKAIYTKDELLARIRTSLGGRAAEIVYYGEKDGVSTGASGDLISATNLAQRIICTYGMDDKFGLAVIDPKAAMVGELSDEVRDAVNQILADQMQEAIRLIGENKPTIDALVEKLLTNNHLSGSEIASIFQQRDKEITSLKRSKI